MLREGLYARVSTLDQQTLPMQMRAYAANRGWTVAMQVKEVGSGAMNNIIFADENRHQWQPIWLPSHTNADAAAGKKRDPCPAGIQKAMDGRKTKKT